FEDIDDGVIEMEIEQVLDAPAHRGAQLLGAHVGRLHQQQLVVALGEQGGNREMTQRMALSKLAQAARIAAFDGTKETHARRAAPCAAYRRETGLAIGRRSQGNEPFPTWLLLPPTEHRVSPQRIRTAPGRGSGRPPMTPCPMRHNPTTGP